MTYSDKSRAEGLSTAFNRRRPLFILLIVLCLLFLASYTGKLGQLRGAERELATQTDRLADAQIQTQVLEAEFEHVSSDAYVVEQAIEALNMARDDETIIVLVDGSSAGEEEDGETAVDDDGALIPGDDGRATATWQQWVDLFR